LWTCSPTGTCGAAAAVLEERERYRQIIRLQTLYHCLVTVSKLLAPFMPYLAEEMYQNLVRTVDKDAPDQRAPD